MKPIGERVIIKLSDVSDRTEGGLFLPSTASTADRQHGTVVALGTGIYDINGTLIPLHLKEGDRVLVDPSFGTDIRVEGKDYKVFEQNSILLILD